MSLRYSQHINWSPFFPSPLSQQMTDHKTIKQTNNIKKCLVFLDFKFQSSDFQVLLSTPEEGFI